MNIFLKLRVLLFAEHERMWKVHINAEGPIWFIRKATPEQAVAQAAGMQWGAKDYLIKRGPGLDNFTIGVEQAHKTIRPMGIAKCLPA